MFAAVPTIPSGGSTALENDGRANRKRLINREEYACPATGARKKTQHRCGFMIFLFRGAPTYRSIRSRLCKTKDYFQGPPQPEMFKNKIYYFTGKYHFGNQNRYKNKGKQWKGVTKRAKKIRGA